MGRKIKKIKYKSLKEQRRDEKLRRRKKELGIILGLIIIFAVIYLLSTLFTGEQITVINNNAVAAGNAKDEAGKNNDLVSSTADYESMSETQKQIQEENRKQAIERASKPKPQPPVNDPSKKVAYLTFDDGPSQNTIKILDILKGYDIKATFFVLGQMAQNNKEIINRQKAEGHLIANHTFSHDYKYLYSSPDNFLRDIKKNEDLLKNLLGEYNCDIVRFPGGSFGRGQAFKDILAKNGYRYFDWNCSNGDTAAVLVNRDTIINNVKNTYGNQKQLVILMHDAPAKKTTPEALPTIIDFLKTQGYEFSTLY